ncbi:hypothetical protein M441DRAFT_52576 [Trichoderma asperellum CBS 433.97]|uniref:Uncharacterized protein n=1 Tax=Trichoderma asperellum (strain ATCC 204424 / CBS 433.97 / NBRC 101777) TaxID=1042311 RepID=A0A2T3YQZ8_TRIA4|nr:hypothetical protein M441DRAFT_52576 [Trichoderma asperellum CBS 433.97]PTB34944.1 hypothetical protein M441DRAFT_52576 [Trichoderma asperellum CBS 433.97]
MAHDFTSGFYVIPPREEEPSSPATDRLSNHSPDIDPQYWTRDEEYQAILLSQRRDVSTTMSDEGYESFSTSQYSNGNTPMPSEEHELDLPPIYNNGNTPLSISDEEHQSDSTSQYWNGNGAMSDEEYQPGLTSPYYSGSTIMSDKVDQIPWEGFKWAYKPTDYVPGNYKPITTYGEDEAKQEEYKKERGADIMKYEEGLQQQEADIPPYFSKVSNFPSNDGTTDLQTQDNQRSVSLCLECLHKQDLQTQDNQRNVSYDSEPTPRETTVFSCSCDSKLIFPANTREEETQKWFIIYIQQMYLECVDEGLRAEVKDIFTRT